MIDMQIKDIHEDVTRYLEEDCYCPGEIYDLSGFFFQTFKPEEACKFVAKGKSRVSDSIIYCVICRTQLLNFWIDETKGVVTEAECYDATENNVRSIKAFLSGETENIVLDEFNPGSTAKSLEDVLKYADAILCT